MLGQSSQNSRKRKQSTYNAAELATYVRLLRRKSTLGRSNGQLMTSPPCRFLRAFDKGGLVEDYVHIYTCEGKYVLCDCIDMEDTRRLVRDSHHGMAQPQLEKIVRESKCIHVCAMENLKCDTTPVKNYGPIDLLHDGFLSVSDGGDAFTRAVVKIDYRKRKYECTAPQCKHNKSGCRHIETINAYVLDHDVDHNVEGGPFLPVESSTESDAESENGEEEMYGDQRLKCISFERISLEHMEERSRQRHAPHDAPHSWLASGTVCTPSAEGLCSQCHAPWSHSTVKVKEKNATLYGSYEALAVTVNERVCPCGAIRPYDGKEDGVFNYSNKTLWLHETLMAYVDLMVEARMPFNAYHEVLQRQYERRGATPMCSKKTLIGSLGAFISMLDVDYAHCFSCPICSQLPLQQQVYIIDGKAMGFQRSLMKTQKKHEETRGSEPAPTIPGTHFAYIGGSKDAQSLAKMVRNFSCEGATPMPLTLYRKMVRLASDHAPELVAVLEYIKINYCNGEDIACPTRFKSLLYDIATPCPISCLIPRELTTVSAGVEKSKLAAIIEKDTITAEDRQLLTTWNSFAKAMTGMERVPQEFRNLVHRLIVLAQLPGKHVRDADSAASINRDLPDTDPLSFFPNHPIVRKTRVYDVKDDGTTPTCTKKVLKHHTFTPGVFTVFCPHGIAIGFEAMREFESARIPFDIFYTRFTSAPGTIIYDNACNASRYCLRREPLYFALVCWLIDRLHQLNHVGCHSGYNMNAHPKKKKILGGLIELKDINSQAAEQRHAKMKLIETQTSFMSEEMFLQYVKFFLARTNMEILKTL